MEQNNLIPVYIYSRRYLVPEGSTIITAMEYLGFRMKKGVGCKEGFCGACASLYRLKGDFKLKGGLGCQTVVQPEMQLVQIPFVPAPKAIYQLEELQPSSDVFVRLYPELYRCLACNTCTKICPQDLQVMDFVQAAIREDWQQVADLSFDCIMCGLCSARCPSEITQFNIALLARRLVGKYVAKRSPFLGVRIKEIEEGKYEEGFRELMEMPAEELKKRYFQREINFQVT